jgi:glutathione S-transferase
MCPEYEPTVKEQAQITIMDQWQGIETYLENEGPYLLGDRFSACDIYLQMITTWLEDPADLLNTFPNISNLVKLPTIVTTLIRGSRKAKKLNLP